MLYRFDFILVQDGDPDKRLKIPEWVRYELYTRRDIDAALGHASWIISSEDASIRNFGFLVSNRTYIYTLDDDCLPAPLESPHWRFGHKAASLASKFIVNALEVHLGNLVKPSTPFFFNTLYDPYAAGADFVRGYPYSMRDVGRGHGAW